MYLTQYCVVSVSQQGEPRRWSLVPIPCKLVLTLPSSALSLRFGDYCFRRLQIMGPGDSYLLQYSRNIESFWATPYSLALGATFRARQDSGLAPPPRQLVTKVRSPPAATALLAPAFVARLVACHKTHQLAECTVHVYNPGACKTSVLQGRTPSCCCCLPHAAALLISTCAALRPARPFLHNVFCPCEVPASKACKKCSKALMAEAPHQAEVGCNVQDAFSRDVKEGFQASSTWHQGVLPQG